MSNGYSDSQFCYITRQKIEVLWEHGSCCLHSHDENLSVTVVGSILKYF